MAWTSLRCDSVLVVRGRNTRRVKPTAQCAVGSQSGGKDAQDTAFRLAEFKSRVAKHFYKKNDLKHYDFKSFFALNYSFSTSMRLITVLLVFGYIADIVQN